MPVLRAAVNPSDILPTVTALDVRKAVRRIADAAQRRCPVRTGRLRRSQRVSARSIRYTAPYSVYVHARNPWLRRAISAQRRSGFRKVRNVANSMRITS